MALVPVDWNFLCQEVFRNQQSHADPNLVQNNFTVIIILYEDDLIIMGSLKGRIDLFMSIFFFQERIKTHPGAQAPR